MSPLQRKLAALSRDRHFLIRGVLTILLVTTVLGFVAEKFFGHEPSPAERREDLVQNLIRYESQRDRQELADLLAGRGEPTPEAIAEYIRFARAFIDDNLIYHSRNPEAVSEYVPPLEFSRLGIEGNLDVLDEDQELLFNAYAAALYHPDKSEKEKATEFLGEKAALAEPIRFANEFYGDALARRSPISSRAEAIPFLGREAEGFARSDYARFRLLDLHLSLGNREELSALVAKPDYLSLADRRFLVELGIALRSPGLVAQGITRSVFARFTSPLMPLSLLAGLIWFTVVAKLGGVEKLRSGRLAIYGLAVLAGMFSNIPTLILSVWQGDILGFQLNGEFLNDLLYCISNISLREEVSKLLLFLPFAAYFWKRGSYIEMLITAGCVGLGFAITENVGYFDRSGPANAFPRMLTASFAHISLTGLLGLALCRFIRWPKQCWEEFIGTFVAIVLVHGGYDALLMVRQLAEQVGPLAIVVLALLVRQFFHKVADLRHTNRQNISPLGIFVLGCALVVGVSWIFSMVMFGAEVSLAGVGKGAVQMGVVAFMFINQLRNE